MRQAMKFAVMALAVLLQLAGSQVPVACKLSQANLQSKYRLVSITRWGGAGVNVTYLDALEAGVLRNCARYFTWGMNGCWHVLAGNVTNRSSTIAHYDDIFMDVSSLVDVAQAVSAYYEYNNGLGSTPRLPEYTTIVSQQSYPAKVIEFYPQVVKYAPPAK